MSMLHAPVKKDWGRSQWQAWSAADKAFCKRDGLWQNSTYYDQLFAAKDWAAPASIALHIILPQSEPEVATELQVSKQDRGTLRAIIDSTCAQYNMRRSEYYWNLVERKCEGSSASSQPDEADEEESANIAPPTEEEMALMELTEMQKSDYGEQRNAVAFKCLWKPGTAAFWSSEQDYGPLVLQATAKRKPARPEAPPNFALFKSPPPEATATEEEWKSWLNGEHCGTAEYWQARELAIQYRCPDVVSLTLEGISHSTTIDAGADAPLLDALEQWCQMASGGATLDELKLCTGANNDDESTLDPAATSARHLYCGTRARPRVVRVLHRDEKQRKKVRCRHSATAVG